MQARTAAIPLGLPIDILTASDIEGIDAAFAILAQSRPDALMVTGNTLFNNRSAQIAALATQQRLPTIFSWRADAQKGGLMSYGQSAGELCATSAIKSPSTPRASSEARRPATYRLCKVPNSSL